MSMHTGGVVLRTSAPSRLVVRAMAVSLTALVLFMGLLSLLSGLDVHQHAEQIAAESLTTAQPVIEELDDLRRREYRAQVARATAEPPLRLAVTDAHASEADAGDTTGHLHDVLSELAGVLHADVVFLKDRHEQTLASAGPEAGSWPAGGRERLDVDATPTTRGTYDGLSRSGDRIYRTLATDLEIDGSASGRLYVAHLLDDRYVAALARVARADLVILDDTRIVAATMSGAVRRALHGRLRGSRRVAGVTDIGDTSFAYRRLRDLGSLRVYAVTSIDAVARPAAAAASRTLALLAIALGALALAAVFWLTRTIVEPAEQLTRALEERAWSRDVSGELPRCGSRELDGLVDTFQDLMAGRLVVEAETQAACIGAIRAVAAALDARDPHTVGHSERVSALAVAIGRTLSLGDEQLEVLRLGALLHDIGNIGVPDAVLRKPGPLTDAEYDQVKTHPAQGARILRSVPFLAPHVVIVELHHERPDGRGYPYGLRTDATPLVARIVRVADAYDAMTNARAYREAWSPEHALDELWRCAGTGFDEAVVEALAMALRLPAREAFASATVRRSGF